MFARSLKTALVLWAALHLGGCLANAGKSLDASTDGGGPRAKQDADEKETGKRQVCEHTSIGGEAKSFCY